MGKQKSKQGPERRRDLAEINLAGGAKSTGPSGKKRGCVPFFGLLVLGVAAGAAVVALAH